MKKVVMILILFFGHLCQDVLSKNHEGFSWSSQGHSRWTITNGLAPYHAANVLDIFGTYQTPSKNLQLETRITFENPGASEEYILSQRFLGRMSVTYRRFVMGGKAEIKAGDLGKYTLGRGLTVKDMNSMGFDVAWHNKDMFSSLTYIGRGYSDYGDYAIVDCHTAKWTTPIMLGAYYFLGLPQSNSQRESQIIGGYTDVPINGITMNIEAATNLAISSVSGFPVAVMIRPYYRYEGEQTRCSISGTFRYHSAAFNAFYNDYPPVQNFHALEDEADDVDNWRNVLVNTVYDRSSLMIGGGIRGQLSHKMIESFWGIADVEWNIQKYSFDTFHDVFYAIGLSYEWAPFQTVYACVQNKIFSTESHEDYLSNSPVFTAIEPFLVVGLKYSLEKI